MAFGTIRADVIQGTATTINLATAGQYSLGGNILPDVDNSRNIGSPSLRFANIYTGDLHLANDRGDWTVVEESDYLSLKNNKTGKTFRLLMEEVES
jgi:hypothetical protein